MHLERLAFNKFKIVLTMDDLSERGLVKEDIWKDSFKWHQLFDELLEEASIVCGIDIEGSVAVELFSVHTQGMIMIVTLEDSGDNLNDEFLDIQASGYNNEERIYEFDEFEDLIHLSKRLKMVGFTGGTLYHMNNKYFLYIKESAFVDIRKVEANVAEYGHGSLESLCRLQEYGKSIIKDSAVETLVHHFK